MPARISFTSATYPHNHGIWSNQGQYPDGEETVLRLLQRCGYFTALVSKAHYYEPRRGMHLREREGYMHALGLNHVHETSGPMGSFHTRSYATDEWEREGLWEEFRRDYRERARATGEVVRASPLPVDRYIDSYIGRKAVEFIDTYENQQSLCLFVGFAGPHDPWDAPGDFATMYRAQDTPQPIPIPANYAVRREWTKHTDSFRVLPPGGLALIPQIRANYYGKISLIDDRIGHILEAYQRKSWLDDLLVVFLADHGEMLGDHGRLGKESFHESSIRVPLILRWPGRIADGVVTDALAENIDVFPTLLETAGCAASGSWSLWSVLRRTSNLASDPAANGLEKDLLRRLRARLEQARFRQGMAKRILAGSTFAWRHA